MKRWWCFFAWVPLLSSLVGAQEPTPSRLVVLDKVFDSVPVLWSNKEPYAPVSDWLAALQVRWVASQNGIAMETPNHQTFLWTTGTTEIVLNEQRTEVSPLVKQQDTLWVPLISLARVLQLTAIVNAEKQVVKLASALQEISVSQTSLGWKVTLTFSYPLPVLPKTGALRQPDRAYADFLGAVLGDLPEPPSPDPVFIVRFRVGQYSSEPPTVRFVADVATPATFQIVGKEQGQDGREHWYLLLQPLTQRPAWLGQVQCVLNTPHRAVFRLFGWLGEQLPIWQEGQVVSVPLPTLPLLSSELPQSDDGLVRTAEILQKDEGWCLQLSLREPATAIAQRDESGWLLAIEKPFAARRALLIVVDAGHGGKDPGAMSPQRPNQPQLVEKHLTLDIAFRLKRLLEQAGYRVLMTRTDDTYIPLPERVAIANNARADAFVSVHINSFPQPGGQWGTEVYYWTPQSYPLAERIYRNLLSLLGRKGNGIRQRQLYVVRHTFMPAVLVEPCYINHPEEEALLRTEEFRERIALAIFRGIAEFFGDFALERRGE